MDPASNAEAAPEQGARWERTHFFGRLLWLFPFVYCFHILEESNGFAEWVDAVLRGRFSSLLFYLANAWFMVVLLGLTRRASRRRTQASVALLFFWASAQFFWDAVFHVYAENHFSAYSPGYFTAVFLYLPTYGYLSMVALRERFLTLRGWLFGFAAGFLLLGLIVWAGLYRLGSIPWSLWG
jgi:hypothetical protein